MDVDATTFERQLDMLGAHDVVSLDTALDRLDRSDTRPCVVLTFDDGFADVYEHAWPRLRDRGLPFTVYVAGGLIGARMRWEGSAGSSQGAPALTWDQLAEMHGSGLCTIGNHTFSHALPHDLDAAELDRCSETVEAHLGVRPRHFAWTWGEVVDAARPLVAPRFRSAVSGNVGRNQPDQDRLALNRIPVRRTDPLAFFRAKLDGDLLAERAYARVVAVAKRARGATT